MADCAYCGKPTEGNHAIHRDGFGVGPEVDLCDDCGGAELPTMYDIWDRIAQPADHPFAHRELTAQPQADGDGRSLSSADIHAGEI